MPTTYGLITAGERDVKGIEGSADSRATLDQLIDKRRRQLRRTWAQLARSAGMTEENLLRIRKNRISISWSAAEGLETALHWPRGSIEAAVTDGTPPEPSTDGRQPANQGSATAADISPDAELIFEGFRSLFRKHRMAMTPRHLRQFLADVDAELQARANTAGKSITEDDGPLDPQ
jgi:hypothetical protein